MERTKGKVQDKRALKRQKVNEALQKRYDKLKYWKPSKKASMTHFRKIPKFIIGSGLTLPSLAIYPVLCCEDNYKNNEWVQLSQENIKEKSGHSIPTINKAIKELSIVRLIKAKKVNEGKRRFWIYKPSYIKDNFATGKDCFFFYTYLIESGIWRKLDLRAKGLYLAMRSFAEFDFMLYCEVEDLDYNVFGNELAEGQNSHKWEICKKSLNEMCAILGMSASNINIIVKELTIIGLITQLDEGYIVYQLPAEVDTQ